MTLQSATNPHQPPVRFARYENLPPHTERHLLAPALRAGYHKQANDLVQAADGIVVAEFIDHAPAAPPRASARPPAHCSTRSPSIARNAASTPS